MRTTRLGSHATSLPVAALTAFALALAFSARAQSPFAFTQVAAPIRAAGATLNGMAVARGSAAAAWFEWGTDAAYGNTTPPVDIGNQAVQVIRLSAPITNLTSGAVYHFRIVVSNQVAVTLGYDQRFTTGMRIQNWGSFAYGPPAVPAGLTNIVSVAAGHGHCLAVRDDGTVAAWLVGYPGVFYPNYGQATVPDALSNVVSVAGGYSHSLALKEDGTVVAWGKYNDGKAAQVPPGITNVVGIAAGDAHSVALRADGTVLAWGENTSGQTNIPFGLRNVVAIACGSSHSLALKTDGTVAVWGTDSGSGAAPGSATNVVGIAAETFYNLALRRDSTAVGWGIVNTNTPQPVPLTNVAAVASGFGYGEVLLQDGTLVGWGRTPDSTNIPVSLSNVVAVAAGDYHAVGLAPVNLPPRALSSSITGGTNQDLTLSLSGFDPNGDPLSARLVSLPAKGQLFQYTPVGRGAPITSPDTPLADPVRVIFAPEPDSSGVGYAAFDFSVNDGELESTPATFTVSIVPSPYLLSGPVANWPDGGFTLNFTGLTNGSYSVWAATTPGTWTFLGRPIQGTPGQYSYIDYGTTNHPFRFYRVRSP